LGISKVTRANLVSLRKSEQQADISVRPLCANSGLSYRASQILLVIPIIGVTNDFSGSCLHPSQRRIYP